MPSSILGARDVEDSRFFCPDEHGTNSPRHEARCHSRPVGEGVGENCGAILRSQEGAQISEKSHPAGHCFSRLKASKKVSAKLPCGRERRSHFFAFTSKCSQSSYPSKAAIWRPVGTKISCGPSFRDSHFGDLATMGEWRLALTAPGLLPPLLNMAS